VQKAALSVPLLAMLACTPSRPADPLLENREPSPEQAACLAMPETQTYLDSVKQRLMDAWEPPSDLPADQELTVFLRIDSEGELVLALVPDAGGMLEESALDAIEAAKPYPPLPESASCLRGSAMRAVFRNPVR
jgi:hypothetical protein